MSYCDRARKNSSACCAFGLYVPRLRRLQVASSSSVNRRISASRIDDLLVALRLGLLVEPKSAGKFGIAGFDVDMRAVALRLQVVAVSERVAAPVAPRGE